MSTIDNAAKVGIINSEAPLKVKHLLWACSMFVGIIGFGVWFGLYTLNKDIKEAVSPLQTKSSAKEYDKERKQEWNDWKNQEWNPHIKEAVKASNNIAIVLDRTSSRAINTNSIGRNGMVAEPPSQ